MFETMVMHLNSGGELFCGWAWAMLWQSSIVIAILFVADLTLRNRVRATVRYALWMLVLVKLVLPPSLCVPTGVGYWCDIERAVQAGRPETTAGSESEIRISNLDGSTSSPQGIRDKSQISNFKNAPSQKSAAGLLAVESVAAAEMPRTQTAEVARPTVAVTWQGAVLLAWVVGVLVLVLLLLQRLGFVRGLVGQSKPAEGRLREMMEECKTQAGVRGNIELRLTENMLSPAACGLLRPVVLMPRLLLEGLSRERVRTVLMHELMHIRRRDLWVNMAQTALQIAHFYNPLLWLANARIRAVREQAVDEASLASLGDEAGEYGRTLVAVAEVAFGRPHLSLRLVGVVESKKSLAARIRHIAQMGVPRSAKIGLAGLVAVVVAGCVLLPMANGKDTKDGDNPTLPATGGVSDKDAIAFTKVAANGIRVELVGIGEKAGKATPWWGPDGTPLREEPFDKNGETVSPDKDEEVRIFAVMFGNLADGSGGIIRTEPHRNYSGGTLYSSVSKNGKDLVIYENGWPTRRMASITSSFKKGSKSCIVRVGVSNGSWQTDFEADRPSGNGTWGTSSQGGMAGGVTFARPAVEGEKMFMTASYSIDTEKYEVRMVAVDLDGREVKAIRSQSGGSDGFRQMTNTFDMPLARVKTFRIQTRKYEWIEFKDVALKPSGKAPAFVVKGKVTDAVTGKPIAGARVGDDGYAGGKQWTTSDADGNYSYLTWYEEHNIKCSAPGYGMKKDILLTKVFGNEKEKTLNFKLDSRVGGEALGADIQLIAQPQKSEGFKWEFYISPNSRLRYGCFYVENGKVRGSQGTRIDTPESGRVVLEFLPTVNVDVLELTRRYHSSANVGTRTVESKGSTPIPEGATMSRTAFMASQGHLLKNEHLVLWQGLFTRNGLPVKEVIFTAYVVEPNSPLGWEPPADVNGLLLAEPKKVSAGDIDLVAVAAREGVGFDGFAVGDAGCTGESIKARLGKPDEEVKDAKNWWLNYRKSRCIDFWVDPRTNTLAEIRLNPGFKGKLSSGISMSSSMEDVFVAYGRPLREEVSNNLSKSGFDDLVLWRGEISYLDKVLYRGGISANRGVSKIYYEQRGLLVWFKGEKINQLVIFSARPMDAGGHGAGESNSSAVAKLPNGMTVELVGICEHPSEGNQWWKPDGTLTEAPSGKLDMGEFSLGRNESAYEVAAKLGGDESVLSRSMTPERWNAPSARKVGPGKSGQYEDRNGVKNLRATTIVVKRGLEKIDISFGLAGKWRKRLSISPQETAKQKIEDIGVVVNPPYEQKGRASVTINIPNKTDNEMAMSVVAVLKNGEHHQATRSRDSKLSFMASADNYEFYDTSLSQVDHFELSTSDYEWATFRNVSLKPGFKTDVQVEIEKPLGLSEAAGGNVKSAKDQITIDATLFLVDVNDRSIGDFLKETLKADGVTTQGPLFTQVELTEAQAMELVKRMHETPGAKTFVSPTLKQVQDGEKAKISVNTANLEPAEVGAAGAPGKLVTVGFELGVTPHVQKDANSILLDVVFERTDHVRKKDEAGKDSATPAVNTESVSTKVNIAAGKRVLFPVAGSTSRQTIVLVKASVDGRSEK